MFGSLIGAGELSSSGGGINGKLDAASSSSVLQLGPISGAIDDTLAIDETLFVIGFVTMGSGLLSILLMDESSGIILCNKFIELFFGDDELDTLNELELDTLKGFDTLDCGFGGTMVEVVSRLPDNAIRFARIAEDDE